MTNAARKVRDEALKLFAYERGALAYELLASLGREPDHGVDGAWTAEAERRARERLSGEDDGLSWENVRERLPSRVRSQLVVVMHE